MAFTPSMRSCRPTCGPTYSVRRTSTDCSPNFALSAPPILSPGACALDLRAHVRHVDGFVELDLHLRAAGEVDAVVQPGPHDGAEQHDEVRDDRPDDRHAPPLDEIDVLAGLDDLEKVHLHGVFL